MDRDKLRAESKGVLELNAGNEVALNFIALLDALDEAEKDNESKQLTLDIFRTERDMHKSENTLLRKLVKYQHELPMNEAGDYDENVKWERNADKALNPARKK